MKNCQQDSNQEGAFFCDYLPSKNPKIGDVEIPIDIPQKVCTTLTKAMICEKKCSDFCSGKSPNSPFPGDDKNNGNCK